MQIEEIQQLIETGLVGSKAIVTGDGHHFNAVVIADTFQNKSRLQKQQLVYDTVRKYLDDGTLHVLSIKTFTWQEWQASNRDEK